MNSHRISSITICLSICLLLFVAYARAVSDDVPSHVAHDVTEPPAYDDFLIIPLRIHILTATDLPEVDCKLTDADINRIVGKMNGIWQNAGIHFGVESILHESAAQQSEFRDAKGDGPAPMELFRVLRPQSSRHFDGLHVYYVHQLPVNGVFMGTDFAFVKETASLRHVDGGIDEPIPRVSAHELGHALGLPHRQDRTNLMASGTTGTLLNSDEVSKTRDRAPKIHGAATVNEWRQLAEAARDAKDGARAHQIWSWLAEIPGNGAAEAIKQRDAESSKK
jgi:hypothetical protein